MRYLNYLIFDLQVGYFLLTTGLYRLLVVSEKIGE